jgi:hypothetical protein
MGLSTIGDSFSVVATLGGIAVTTWSFSIACARSAVTSKTSSSIGMGFLALLFGVFSFIVVALPNPITKLLGTIMLASYLGLIAIGVSGISKLAAERLRDLKGGSSNLFDSYAKAALYIVMAAMLPILGWFILAPMLILFGGGAGLKAVLKPVRTTEVA